MTVQRLIELALRQIGQTNPSPEEVQASFDHLNMIVSNCAFWDDSVQPVKAFAALSDTINLPPFYVEWFEMELAAKEGQTYGLTQAQVSIYEAKAKQFKDRITYRHDRDQNLCLRPSGQVV